MGPYVGSGGEIDITVTPTYSHVVNMSAVWYPNSSKIVIEAIEYLSARNITIEIPRDNYFILPSRGVRSEAKELWFQASSSYFGNTTKALSINSIGLMNSAFFTMDPVPTGKFLAPDPRSMNVDNPVSLKFQFNANVRLVPKDTITVYLAGFTCSTIEIMITTGGDQQLKGAWDNTHGRLTVTVSSGTMIARNSWVNFTVASSHGMTLPREGILENSDVFSISVEAEDGGVVSVPFDTVPAAGRFQSASLVFSPRPLHRIEGCS